MKKEMILGKFKSETVKHSMGKVELQEVLNKFPVLKEGDLVRIFQAWFFQPVATFDAHMRGIHVTRG